jgi:hypothetical protein
MDLPGDDKKPEQEDSEKPNQIRSNLLKLLRQPEVEDENTNLLKCNKCGMYSKLTCSKTSYKDLKRLAKIINESIYDETGIYGTESPKTIYQCIECLLIDRLPSFYIHHENEIYEGLHESMQRQ